MLIAFFDQNLSTFKNHKTMKYTFTFIALLVAQIIFGQNRVQKIDSTLMALHSIGKLNGNVLIAEKGEVIFKKSFGIANEETKQMLNENSIFELASCSKQFTSMAIMILKEKGRLNLDDNISKFIPELAFYKGITIRHLLNHTAGLPDYMEIMDSIFDKSKIATNKDVVSIFAKKQPKTLFEPNSNYAYSNTGYALLAIIIEKTSGETYANFLQKAIFKPLKMKNTFVYTRRFAPKQVDNYAFGYVYSDSLINYLLPDNLEETKMVIWLDGIVGDGCVNSTVNDLLKWDRALYTNKLLSKAGMKEIFKVATLNDKSKTKYGFGWGIDDNPDYGKIVFHGGGWPGYVSYFDRHIGNDKTIIILQNHNDVTIPVKSIRSILYNESNLKSKGIILSKGQLQKCVGVYELNAAFQIEIETQNDHLIAKTSGQPSVELFAETESSFFIKEIDAQVVFNLETDGTVKSLTFSQGGKKMEGKKIR